MTAKRWRRNGRDFTSPLVKITTHTGQENIVMRDCLKCGKSFRSLGKANRICEKCNASNEYAPRQIKLVTGRKFLSEDGDRDGV